ncbi:4-hydroxy-3-polyprenylbenzoate decarboxylase [Anaerosolibacter carboniphilus]|uniref:Flavin prenyltransferase UbiX n=1 Tax=Anaerosolibacter carboniphilus TaxID=1417629 RepID=A0A841L481_9FIRM|nr:flavin prenyltransferase UbiX [Anaerosolibacter carboniphilus]MBB6217135.1 4-hydroxy-3-polyprenylbenzoate decarboxylase [Anaerosolibacter carboniphilus]
MSKFVLGVTGASGSIYAVRLLEELLKSGHEVFLVCTKCGEQVLNYEVNLTIEHIVKQCGDHGKKLRVCAIDDLFAPIASGSFLIDGMVVLPCSMSTMGKISHGIGDNLLIRAADVCIKEKRNLVLVPRETPLSTIHLKNMLSLSEMGVTILPAMPSFYHKPRTIEDMIDAIVGRVMRSLGIENHLYHEWNGGV